MGDYQDHWARLAADLYHAFGLRAVMPDQVDRQTLTQLAAVLGTDGVQRDLHPEDANAPETGGGSVPSTIAARIAAARGEGPEPEARAVGLGDLQALQDVMV